MNKISGNKIGLLLAVAILPLSQHALADNGFYVGGALGKAYIDEKIDGLKFKADDTSYKISAGYDFNENFAVEASYLDLGTFNDTFNIAGQAVPVSAKADGYSIAAIGTLPLSEQFSARAHAGFYFYDSQTRVNGIIDDNDSDEAPFVGLGLAYDVSEQVQLSFDVDYYDMDGTQPVLASLGFIFRF